ncbi:hypothetical protein Asulf_00317 [Archaeoglobus sulfaticallidus PM70-1]|uniref:Uncharacterized protein n=1 Tax=Archaeoglobus sulfaticallidus PM70-1 TaxID=387631 RepID=N0B9S6_9EURY|nr:hypothetical protein [Archaeoglobus sulfaticallidus]AGK60349.1 hypothetical protein Asulf_00317 [Archaeoglobus sulfaticallidus PM70-1]
MREIDKICKKCAKFSVHEIYSYIGFCVERKVTVRFHDVCEDFTHFDFETKSREIFEKGWVYCMTCRMPIFSVEELEEHEDDIIVREFFLEEVHEELHSAD